MSTLGWADARGSAQTSGRACEFEVFARSVGERVLLERVLRQLHDLTAFERRLVGDDADAGPVGRLNGVGIRVAAID